jgi:hypothetical protein
MAPAREPDEVGFTVKELFQRIEKSVDSIRDAMILKAGTHELEGLRSRIEAVERVGSYNAQEALKKVEFLDVRFNTMGWKIAGSLLLALGSALFTVIWSLVRK